MPRLLLLNNVLLFLCWSIYIGTGVSLIFFQYPLEPLLTPDNYMLIFVEPVHNATDFFTYMTIFMLASGLVMAATEWFTGIRWAPIVALAALIASTVLTMVFIFPYNDELYAGIRDPERLKYMFGKWADLNRIRVSLWVIGWVAMMYWFYRMAKQARADR